MMLQDQAAHKLRFGRPGRSRAAFTILEILVVLFILGMLVAVLFQNTDKILGKGSESVAGIFVNQGIKTPLMTYRMDMRRYPTTEEGLQALITAPGSAGDKWRGPYLEDGEIPLDPWGNPYQYRRPGTKNTESYDVFSLGADGVESNDDIGNW